MKAATWALKNGTNVVICNGCEEKAIINIVKGKKVGTFFTMTPSQGTPVEVQAREGRVTNVSIVTIELISDLQLSQESDCLPKKQTKKVPETTKDVPEYK